MAVEAGQGFGTSEGLTGQRGPAPVWAYRQGAGCGVEHNDVDHNPARNGDADRVCQLRTGRVRIVVGLGGVSIG